MQPKRMAMARPAFLTITVIAALGWILATVTPPYWQLSEMVLFAACIALLWEAFRGGQTQKLHGVNDSLAGKAWFADATADTHSQEFRPWDVEQAISRLRPTAARVTTALNPTLPAGQSVEQITHEMLAQAFRQASLKHHPADVSDSERTRRVYAARATILHALHKS